MPVIVLVSATAAVAAAFLTPATAPTVPAAPTVAMKLVAAYPHDVTSFCQGLVVHNGALLEGTGHYRQSKLRLVDLKTGKPTMDLALPADVFGEGVAIWKDSVLQLTWQNGYLIKYDLETFQRTGTVALRSIDSRLREGWGITHDGQNLIISDGSDLLRFVDPATFQLVRRLRVKDGFRGVSRLNELEFVKGMILANVWYKDQIAMIDPETGRVTKWLDLAAIRPASVKGNREAALNGIAWDDVNKRLFVTGKNWPNVFEVRF